MPSFVKSPMMAWRMWEVDKSVWTMGANEGYWVAGRMFWDYLRMEGQTKRMSRRERESLTLKKTVLDLERSIAANLMSLRKLRWQS